MPAGFGAPPSIGASSPASACSAGSSSTWSARHGRDHRSARLDRRPCAGVGTCAAALYWLGGRHGCGGPAAWADRWRLASFVVGLVAIVVALGSPIDGLADRLFWAHMVQHVLLIGVAPALLALARPWNRMWRGLPLELRRPIARAITKDPRLGALRGAGRFVAEPLPSWLIFNLTFLAWHLPGCLRRSASVTLRSRARARAVLLHRAAVLDPGHPLAALALAAQRGRQDRLSRHDDDRRLGAGDRLGAGAVADLLRLRGPGDPEPAASRRSPTSSSRPG